MHGIPDKEDHDLEKGESPYESNSFSPCRDDGVQIGIAFYMTAPTNSDAPKDRTNPLARRDEKRGNLWKYCIEDPLIRRYAKDMKYKHCEIAFTKDLVGGKAIPRGHVLAYGIIRDGILFGKYRTFSSDQYDWKWIMMSPDVAIAMQRFCIAQVGKKYDATAAKRSAFFPKPCDYKQWYCTDFVVAALQQGDIMLGKNPRSQTTDDVYDIVCQQGNIIERLSPFRRTVSQNTTRETLKERDPSRIVHMEKRNGY